MLLVSHRGVVALVHVELHVEHGQPGGFLLQLLLLGERAGGLLAGGLHLGGEVFQVVPLARKALFHDVQGVVDAGDVAHLVGPQLRRVGKALPGFEGDHELLRLAVNPEGHGKAPVLAQGDALLRVGHPLAGGEDGSARVLALGVGAALDHHVEDVALGGVGAVDLQIGLQPLDLLPRLLDGTGEKLYQPVLQLVLLPVVVGFEELELGYRRLQLGLFLDAGVAGGEGLDLGVGEGGFVHVLAAPGGALGGHHLPDELLLCLHDGPVIGVEGALGHVLENLHLLILVSLAQDAPLPLLNVGGPPGTIQMVQRHKPVLDIGARPHFGGGPQQHPDLPLADLGEQLRLLRLGLGVVNVGDLLGGDPLGHELVLDVVVDVESAVVVGGGQVAEHKLGPLGVGAVPPHLEDVLDGGVHLAVGVVGQQLIGEALVQGQLAPVRRDFEHIVLVGLHLLLVDRLGPLPQLGHHLLLVFGGLGDDVDVLGLRDGEMEHIRRLNVGGLLPERQELRQVVETGETGLGPKAGAGGVELYGRHLLPEGAGPAIKMLLSNPLQGVRLEVAHHGVELHHAVGDGGAGGEGDAPPAGELVHIAALGVHIAGLLRVGLPDARDVAHLGVGVQVLKAVGLVHKQAVHAQLLEGDDVILLGGGLQLFQLDLQIFAGALQLFDGVPLAVLLLGLRDAVHNFVDLLIEEGPLAAHRQGYPLELGVPDDNGIKVAGGDAGTEFFAVLGLEVLFGGDQDIRAGIELQELAAPLLGQVVGDDEQGLAAQAQPPALHRRRHHFKGLARADTVGQQRIFAVEDMGHGIELMGPQGNLRVHAIEADVGAVVLAGPDGVENGVVLLAELLPPLGVLPNPRPERLFHGLLALLGQSGLLAVEDPFLPAVRVGGGVIDPAIPEVQRVLQDGVGIPALGAVGGVDEGVGDAVRRLALDVPFMGVGGVLHGDFDALEVAGGVQQLHHELLIVMGVNPVGA